MNGEPETSPDNSVSFRPVDAIPIVRPWFDLIVESGRFAGMGQNSDGPWLRLNNRQSVFPEA